MTPEQKAAYITAMAACANAEIEGMKQHNAMRERAGSGGKVYEMQDFLDVPVRYGIHHNAVIGFFHDHP